MSRVYVGNLPIDVREKEIEDIFYKFGPIREIDIKRPVRPPAFAFVAFEHHRGTSNIYILTSINDLLTVKIHVFFCS